MKERAQLVIDLDRLKENYLKIKEKAKCEVIAVVKADAYGHGAKETVRALDFVGCNFFCVATADEAFEVRRVSDSDVLILGYTEREKIKRAQNLGITLSLYNGESLSDLESTSVKAKVHIKVNTGMNRLGFTDKADVLRVLESKNADVRGIFSHFHSAEFDPVSVFEQARRFSLIENDLDKSIIRHISASAACALYGAFGYSHVRAGISLYGFSPFADTLPAISLFARVVAVNAVKKGESVGYGAEYKVKDDARIATLSIGYADGLGRDLSGIRVAFSRGGGVICGKICMDMCMVLLDADAETFAGDGCEIFSFNGSQIIEREKKKGVSAYETLTSFGKRIKRIYR